MIAIKDVMSRPFLRNALEGKEARVVLQRGESAAYLGERRLTSWGEYPAIAETFTRGYNAALQELRAELGSVIPPNVTGV